MAKKSKETAVTNADYTEDEYPLRIRGQWCDRVDSPLPDYPGCIYVVTNPSARQFMTFWEKTHDAPEGELERYQHLWDYQRIQHLVLAWHIHGLDNAKAEDESGASLPAIELAWFAVQATRPATMRALNLPNLPGWWPNSANTATSGDETAVTTPAEN